MPTFLRYAAPTELPPDSDLRSYKDFALTELSLELIPTADRAVLARGSTSLSLPGSTKPLFSVFLREW